MMNHESSVSPLSGHGHHHQEAERGRRGRGPREGAIGGAGDDHGGGGHDADADGRLQRALRHHAGTCLLSGSELARKEGEQILHKSGRDNISPIQEYATTVKSADVGLPWEVHFRAKRQFELTDLKVIFQFCLQVTNANIGWFLG